MVMRLFCCLLLLTAMPLMAATTLEASVDKNPVLAGEFFMLNISIDDSIKGQQPDTSALLKDFVVGPMSLSSRTNIINGSIKKQTSWSVKLMTRKAGEYTIPSFSVAGLNSQPISLSVKERSSDADKNNDIFLKTSLSNNSLFVQEAGVYTIKLYLAKELLDGSLSAPSMENAQLTQLGKQSEDYELVNGKRYLVITRNYLIQPQKSGAYTIAAPVFQGRIQQNYRQLEVSALGDEQQIEIKPIPENYQGDWLPSELVSLTEQWQPEDNTVEAGTPITRTIMLTALGVTKEQLPEIDMPTINGIRSYPDEKETNNAVRDGRVVSQQSASYALLPQTPGTYTLPEISLPWYNTKMNRISYATLPERTITVTPSTTAPVQTLNPPAENNLNNTMAESTEQAVTVQQQTVTPLWLIIVASLGYVLWIATVIFYFIKRPAKEVQQAAQTTNKTNQQPSLKALLVLAKSHDEKAFYDALNQYALTLTGKKVGALSHLCAMINNSEFTAQVNNLQAQLYSKQTASANLDAIVSMLKAHQSQTAKPSSPALKELYS